MKTLRFKKFRLLNIILILSLLLPAMGVEIARPTQVVQAAGATHPLVAIHVSELTQALEGMNNIPPTPPDTGKQWWYTSWHYFVIPESLKIALESDGTPYVIVTDADIAAGALMDGGSPKYPIVFSLATEAVADDEIQPLRSYVNAGGFLFIGSSAFTRNPDGTTRANFALASEMGLNMMSHTLENWTTNSSFTHSTDHRLVSHIPTGTVTWDMLLNAEDVVWGSSGAQQLWRTVAEDGAEVIATGGAYPLLATKDYGSGRFIYHAILNPIVGAGGYDSGMYAYTIYRNAVEWAFEAANLPIVRRSPWPYVYDAAFIIRHDFENYFWAVNGGIESSAQYEHGLGLKGDYYFCTGILRTHSGDKQPYIDSLRKAVTDYGASIGPHNGGYPNIGVVDPGAYDYWHWGPDTMIDRTSGFPAPYEHYTSGHDYSVDSIKLSFEDIEGWLEGVDNGRTGCGATDDCPRIWVSPYFNSGRDRSLKILSDLGAVTMGEQKVSPFPHWTLSYDPATIGHRYSALALPPSDWYVGTRISQSQEDGHNTASIQALVDFYYEKGYFLNLYGHSPSNSGNMKTYVDYSHAKGARMWATNSVDIYDWWVKRDTVVVTPDYSKTGNTAMVTATISGASDTEAAIEFVLPHWSSGAVGDLQVLFNGVPANPSEFRTTNYGLKVRVGTAVTNVQVSYTPLEGWVQTDWHGGDGQAVWSDATKYASSTDINDSVAGQISLSQSSGGAPLFSDDFNRSAPPPPEPVPFTWTITGIPGNYGLFDTTGGTLNTSLSATSQYGYAYKDVPAQPSGDYTVEADIRFPHTTHGGGIFGRLNPVNGSRYAVWIYPPSNLRLIRFNDWSGWVSLGDFTIPPVGTGWHHLKMVFNGSNIQVFYDNGATPTHNVTDPTYTSGFVGIDYWSTTLYGPSYNNYTVTDNLGNPIFSDDFGEDAVEPNLLPPWTVYTGSWSIPDLALRATGAGLGNYANIYYDPSSTWTDYSVQAKLQFPTGAFGGGLAGRLNPATGTRYTAWVYAGDSRLNLLKWSNWNTWASISQVSIPAVGTGWHDIKMDFSSSHIRVYWDGALLIDAVDSAYTSGGIGFDAYAQGGAYLIAADDVQVTGPSEYASSGVLTSSAFDGGVGAEWYDVSWYATLPADTSLCVRTRTANTSALLASASWSSCYASSGSPVTSPDLRWIQYQVELETSDVSVTPHFSEIGITYKPGSYLPQSSLTYTGPASGDSQTTVTLSAALMDESDNPIVGRAVVFTLAGLAPVMGVTNVSGIATAPLPLDIAPGTYLLTAAFDSDGIYGPSSASITFTVTHTWSEWIQDSHTHFSAGTLSGVDTEAIPGSVILLSQQIGEGEEYGPFTLDSGIYNYRRRIYVDNPNSSPLPAGYSLKLVMDSAALVSASKLLASGDDLRLVKTGGASPLELDRVADTAFNTGSTEIWFKTQAAIPPNSRDNSYYIYYDNPAASAPPSNPANVFALYDGFDGASVDTNLWTQSGPVTVSGGWAHLAAGGNLFGKQAFTYGALEMRIQAAANSSYMWWGWEDGVADAPNFIVFEYYTSPTNLAAFLRSNNNPYQMMPISSPPDVTEPHVYATEWQTNLARWYIDGLLVQDAATGVPTTPMHANFNATTVAFDIDWVRGRLTAAQEPTVTLASTYSGYVANGAFTSIAYDTGGAADWKYLVWEALRPAGTALTLRVRTASAEAGLASAGWVDYPQSGLLITNSENRWVQYQALLSTTDSLVTPELRRVVIYYANSPTSVILSSFTIRAHLDTARLEWETASEMGLIGFHLFRSETLSGEKQLLNTSLIPAEHPGQMIGTGYQHTDTVEPGRHYYYWLELVTTLGSELNGPLELITDFWLYLPLMSH